MAFRTWPRRVPVDGKGVVECARTGFLFKPHQVIKGKNGMVARKYADWTPGFGTDHPQDRYAADTGGDPSPVENDRGIDTVAASKEDLNISDAEIRQSIVEGRPPRPGF